MQPSGQPQSADQSLRTLPIVVIAMMMGLIMFAGVAVLLNTQQQSPLPALGAPPPPPGVSHAPLDDKPLLIAMAGIGIVAVVGQLALAKVAASQAKAKATAATSDQAKRDAIAPIFMITSIARAALAEGVGLLGAVIVLLTGNLLGLAGVGVAVVLMAFLLPARSRFDNLLRDATQTRFGM